MLPSSKRPPRNQEEVIRTGDYEVILPKSNGASEASDDEDRTLLFAGSTKSMLPPRSATPVPTPSMRAPRVPDMSLRGLVREGRERPQVQERTNLRGSVRRPADAEDRTILRPTSTMPPPSRSSAPPQPRPASARPPAMMPTPYASLKPSAPPVALSVNAPGGSDARKAAPSDPHGDPPSSVITAKTRIVRAKSSLSWAAGLVALGAVVGLVTTVIVRGDADSIIDATASLVDPQHGMPERANGAAAQAAILPAFVETAAPKPADKGHVQTGACLDVGESTVSAPVVLNTPPPATKTASIPGADPTTASRPTPPKPAPVAYARPIPRPAPPAAPAPATTSGGWLANITPPGAGAPIARPSKVAKNGPDFEGAAAADALAKAQLEASLR